MPLKKFKTFGTFRAPLLFGGGSGVAAPTAPTGLAATVISTSRIDLAWTDAATTETEYRVYRSTDGVSYSLLATIAASSNSYSDTTITAGTTYYYKVAAYNVGGETLSSAVKANTLTLSLISHWGMNEASGNRADSIGSNTLTDNNTVGSNTGKIGNAAEFVAANLESLTCTSNASLETGDINFSLDAWFYAGTFADRPLVTKASVDSTTGYEYALYLYNTGTTIGLVVGSNAGVQSVKWNATLTINTWYHVVGWHDTDTDTINISVNNGTPVSAARTVTPVAASGKPFSIGGLSPAYYSGRIDLVNFAKRLWTAAERAALYNSGNGFNGFLP